MSTHVTSLWDQAFLRTTVLRNNRASAITEAREEKAPGIPHLVLNVATQKCHDHFPSQFIGQSKSRVRAYPQGAMCPEGGEKQKAW